MLYATYDQIEAMTMGHRVAVTNDGELQQSSILGELHSTPTNASIAGFICSPSMNLFGGLVNRTGTLKLVCNSRMYTILDHQGAVILRNEPKPGEVIVGIDPKHIEITSLSAGVPASVRLVETLEAEHLIHLEIEGLQPSGFDYSVDYRYQDRILVKSFSDLPTIVEGDKVGFTVDAKFINLFDISTGLRIEEDDTDPSTNVDQTKHTEPTKAETA